MQNKNQQIFTLESPFYFPLEKGQYEVKPGLYKFPHDFGNGNLDRHVFQIDCEYHRYRADRLAARAERLDKYYCQSGFDKATAGVINRFITQKKQQQVYLSLRAD